MENLTVPNPVVCQAYYQIKKGHYFWLDYFSNQDPSSHWLTIFFFACIYSFIFVFGLLGNGAIVYLTSKHKTLQTVQNIFIINLALADIILCLLSVSLTPVTHIFKRWYFGYWLCKIVGGIQAVAMFINSFSLCAIAVDRYFRLVLYPNKHLTKQNAIRITYAFWLVGIGFALPYVYHMRLRTYKRQNACGKFCTEHWPSQVSKGVYSIVVLIFQAVLPFSIIILCYKALFAFLRKRAFNRMETIAQQLCVLATTAGGETQQSEQLQSLIEQKRRVNGQKKRVTVILVSMVVIFGLSSLPHTIVSLITEFDLDYGLMSLPSGVDLSYIINLFSHCMAMISVVTNPILYAFLNPEFRELVLNSLQCLIPSIVHRQVPTTQLSAIFSWRTIERGGPSGNK